MDQLMGQRINLLMNLSESRQHDVYMQNYLISREKKLINQPRVLQGRRQDGTSFPVRLTINETRVDNAHFFIGVMQDFTAIQDAQDMLLVVRNLALEAAARVNGNASSGSPQPGRSLSVLLVEDHDINRKLAEIMLQRMGYGFDTANDGQHALGLLDQHDFDVVLMDVMMPVMDGLTALRLLREKEAGTGRRTAVLMVTAHAMTGDKERFLAAGADGYVSKPMSQEALQKEINRVVVADTPDGAV
eukprot:gene18919-21522_t